MNGDLYISQLHLPLSRHSPPGNALQELNTQDPYLSAPSDPEESDFHASAIRLTPVAGSPNHSSSPNGSRRPSIQASTYVSSKPSTYIAPSDIELAENSGVWPTEDSSSLSGGVTAPCTNATWAGVDVSDWLNPEQTIPSPLSTSENLTIPGHAVTTQPGLGISNSSSGPSSLAISTDQAPEIGRASAPTRVRSPIVTVSKVSRGDSPTTHQRRPSRSTVHLFPGGPDEASSESDHEDIGNDRRSVSSLSVARTHNGHWIPNPSTGHGGLDPAARGNEYVPSPNELHGQREREQKKQDITLWSASVSAANSEAGKEPSSPPRKKQGSIRLRARSTGDRPFQQEDCFNLKFSGSNRSIPGPGAMLHESSEDEVSEETDEAGDTDAESLHIDDPSRNDCAVPGICPSFELSNPDESFRLYPWQDPPNDPTPRTEARQPQNSTAAMVAFEKRAKDLETASRTATIDNNSIINFGASFGRLKLSDQPKTKARRSSSLLKRPFFSSKLKRQASDLSNSSDNSAAQQGGSEMPQRKESICHLPRLSLSSKHTRSPSLSSALISMSGQIAAVGGSRSVHAVSPNPPATPMTIPPDSHGRSRSEIPRPVAPGLIDLMTSHGGSPVAGIDRYSSSVAEAEQAPISAVPEARIATADAEDDMDMADETGLVMEFPPVARLPEPSFEGFKAQIMQLNPRLEQVLIHRFAHAQLRRYKNFVELQKKHLAAVAQRACKAGKFCFAQGGEASLLQQRKIAADSKQGRAQSSYVPGDGSITAAQFPPGVPLPPVSRLPAQFECPLCFEVKTFQKPSDWSKHVHEDVQPFTCSFPQCDEPKSFKRKADWVRHESERHRQLEWWTCSFPECGHTCLRKNNFVQHLVREHKMPEPKVRKTRGSAAGEGSSDSPREQELDRVSRLVDDCRHETKQTPRQEPCRFCGNICGSWKKLTVHLGKHMEQMAMPVLELAKQSCAAPSQVDSTQITGRSAETYPPLAAHLHARQGHDGSRPSSALLPQPQYPTASTSTPASHNFPYDIPQLNYPSISGNGISMEPESIVDSLPPDDRFTGLDQDVLHAQAVTYPPPYNAIPRPRTPDTNAVMPQDSQSYSLSTQLHVQSSLYPAQGSYPGAYQPVAQNGLYTSEPYTPNYLSHT